MDQPVLFLCFSNRCGSNHLAQLLASTGAFNEAGEFFNAATVLEHAARQGVRSLPDYLRLLPRLVPAHRCLAAKAAPDQLVMLADAGVLDGLGADAAYVLLERQDRVGQAISRVIAVQTGQWRSDQPRALPDTELHYDRSAIEAELDAIFRTNAAFYAFFAANGIVPVHLTYEAVLADPASAVSIIGERVDEPGLLPDPGRISLQRQSGRVNREWRERFEAGM